MIKSADITLYFYNRFVIFSNEDNDDDDDDSVTIKQVLVLLRITARYCCYIYHDRKLDC